MPKRFPRTRASRAHQVNEWIGYLSVAWPKVTYVCFHSWFGGGGGLYWGKRDSGRELGWEAEGPSLKTSPTPAQGSRVHRCEPMGGHLSRKHHSEWPGTELQSSQSSLPGWWGGSAGEVTAAKADDVRLTPRTHTGRRPPQAIMACPCSHTHVNE